MIPIWILAIAVGVGFCIGSVGVGGILLLPALIATGLTTHQAQSTALFTFSFTGLYGAWLFQRRGSIQWREALPVCAGASVFTYLGAWVNSLVEIRVLNLVVASIVVFTGVYLLIPAAEKPVNNAAHSVGRLRLLLGLGAASGFGSGLSGAGGPLFLVPMMLAVGFAPVNAVGAAQVLQIVSGISGSLGNLRYGSINFHYGIGLALAELAGVFLGVQVSHRAKLRHLRLLVACLCLVVGVGMFFREL